MSGVRTLVQALEAVWGCSQGGHGLSGWRDGGRRWCDAQGLLGHSGVRGDL